MAEIAIFRINYKSDFILTLNSDAGWMTPFCIKFWTGAPSQAYFVGFDGTTYTHCAPVAGEPTKLLVQFDDHHLPIGDLKFQIGYHFTVEDFPTSVEDEVINQDSVIIKVDDAPAQVMLDLNGETAPEIEFSLPAYANEAQRIANEEQRIAAEAIRIVNEESRIAAETIRQQNEAQRISNEESRVAEFDQIKQESETATDDANSAATLANEKAQLAADKAALADDAATLANAKAQLAADKAALADAAATLANDKAALAQQKAEYAQTQGDYAKAQGDYAKQQGEIAEEDHERAESDHTRAESDHATAGSDHTQAGTDHTRAESDHATAADDHTQAGQDHTTAASDHSRAESDHTTAAADHTQAGQDHTTAASDHTQAGSDHTRAESDHTRAESDHAAVEVYVDSLGAFDISAYHATGGVLAKYADLTAALGTNGANIPDTLRKGGMSVKFVQSSDNNYVQYMYNGTNISVADFINLANWEKINLESDIKILNQDVNGKYDYSFYAATGEHASTLDKFPIDYKAGTTIKGKISLGTANWNGASLRVYLYTDSEVASTKTITIGQEFEISANIDAKFISFYIYNITSAGSFIVNLNYGGIEKEIDEIEEKQTTIVNDLGILRYTFAANEGEHSSTLDKMPVRFHKGDIFKGKISLGTAAFNGASLRAYFFDSNGAQVTNKVVTMGEEFSLRLDSDVSYLSFYIYRITIGGTFNVEVIQEVANGVSVLQENFEGEKAILDYSNSTIGATYAGRSFVLAKQIATNKAFTLYISTNDSSNNYYFNFYNSAGTRIGNYIRLGCGSRKIELTNTYGDAISWFEIVVVKIVTLAIYDVSLLVDGESNLSIELGELGKNVSWLPNYLSVPGRYSSMLSTKESSIRDAMLEAGDDGSTFVFITDVHWPNNSKHSPALINYILQHLPIEDVFFGGDVINGGDATTQVALMSDFGQKMHQAAKRFFPIAGNHDFNNNDGGTGFDGDYFYTLLLKYADYQIVSGEYNNFYYDNDRTKTRYIALNTGTNGDYHTSEQASWLSSLLNEMPLGYHAIIFLHVAYMTASDLENNIMTATMAAAVSVADTFNGQNNGKKVEAFICGHLHNDANKTTTGGIPIILTDCDSRQTSSSNAAAVDTIGEQAFDVITVNYSGTITCTRIGRGNDRVIEY